MLPLMGSQRVGHNLVTEQQQHPKDINSNRNKIINKVTLTHCYENNYIFFLKNVVRRVALLYFGQISFLPGLREDSWSLIPSPVFSLFQSAHYSAASGKQHWKLMRE